MFQKMKLGSKMLISFLLVGALPFIIVGVASLQQASSALKKQSFSELRTAQNFKKKQLTEYFENLRNDMKKIRSNETLVNGLAQFTRVFNEEGIASERWKAFDAFFGPDIRTVIGEHGYEEMYLISSAGDIVFSVKKTSDLGQNVVSGNMKASAFADAFKKSEKQPVTFADVSPYALLENRPTGFIIANVADKADAWIGSIAIPLPMAGVNSITLERSGLGQTGETYLVGSDFLMRSDASVDPENHSVEASFRDPENGKVDTPSVRAALAGKSGQELSGNYLGTDVLSTYEPFDVFGVRWAFVSEIERSEAFAAVNSLRGFIAVIGIITLAGILFVAWFITRSIDRPIHRVIDRLRDGSNYVDTTATMMASASQSLSAGASEEAAAIEETSSTLEEISSMINQNADHAKQANEIMAAARDVVAKANESMAALTTSISEISRSSDETSKIVKTIDEIAFQTNLLALNAAVEAARAGHAGAGFAVVADEVRNLALRATEAAKGTADLIEENVKRTKSGSEIVSSTNKSFKEMLDSTQKAEALVSEIASASREQAHGINQINTAVTEVDRKIQESAATAEEAAAASQEMNKQASEMKEIVDELVQIVGSSQGRSGKLVRRRIGAMPWKRARKTGKALSEEKAHSERLLLP